MVPYAVEMVRLIEIAVPLLRPFRSGLGEVTERRLILVGVERNGVTGWGEAAPYPGLDDTTIDDAWNMLTSGREDVPAFENALLDLAARAAGVPLWKHIGGRRVAVPASIAIGASGDVQDAVDGAVAEGYRAVKVKITPGHDVAVVQAIREHHPDLVIGVDANGTYRGTDRGVFHDFDRLRVRYVEQPFARGLLDAHRALREEVAAAVVVDESVPTVDAAVPVVAAGAADVLAVKPARLGISGCRAVHDLAAAAGLRVKASGLLETGIGRAHTLAVATLPVAAYSDAALATSYFAVDPVAPQQTIVDTTITPSERPGIGVDPDENALAALVVREAILD